jgi:hypothetical protein
MQIIGESPLRQWTETLYKKYGFLSPALVMEAARPEDSPAHAYVFNATPGEAAEQYYLTRAHELIRRVRVQIVGKNEEAPRRVRFFHAVPGGEESQFEYHPLDVLVRQPDKLDLARNEAVRRLRDAERSVEDFDMLASDMQDNERTKKALAKVREARTELAEA